MDAFSTADDLIFSALGVVAQVRRVDLPPIRIILVVRDGVERLGEFQQVVGRARHVIARNREWLFRRGDEVTLPDRTQTVETVVKDDGLINEAVLHG
ncbi:hypothetical protein [Lysobacter gummosus]|uniref:Uncharacterized protein n=1 Tax=Lysobacter gummosus TaxID=262324 RepID=A0ABY3X9I7_9GAMM|nr:hypothetical protein [Lysobacter gummosus]ALN93811.1 hypothetical protein LG3211_4877 [Lysobacter gummosus]UNP29249.1 hypothetical protein MOV92_22730 [Lysobacter gummosus]